MTAGAPAGKTTATAGVDAEHMQEIEVGGGERRGAARRMLAVTLAVIRDLTVVALVPFCAYLWYRLDEAHDLATINYVLKEDDDCEFNQARRLGEIRAWRLGEPGGEPEPVEASR